MRVPAWLWSTEGIKTLAGTTVVVYLKMTTHTNPTLLPPHLKATGWVPGVSASITDQQQRELWGEGEHWLHCRSDGLCCIDTLFWSKLIWFVQKCVWGIPSRGNTEGFILMKFLFPEKSDFVTRHKTETKEIPILKTITKQKLLKLKKSVSKTNLPIWMYSNPRGE